MGFLSALFLGNRIFKLRKVTMHQHENQQENFEDEQTHSGGAAPEQRRCQYIKADGHGCRDWAVRGQKLCYRHGVFVHSGRGIDVPLLEDESSIVLVLSETLRAVALGTIPLKSGALLLDGCRLAHTMQMEKQKAANLERSRRRSEAREEQMAQVELDQEEIGQAESGQEEIGQESSVPDHETDAPSSGICALRSEPYSELAAPMGARAPRYEQAQAEALAAEAALFDELMEEELAIGVR
jgi:hypothetical protein